MTDALFGIPEQPRLPAAEMFTSSDVDNELDDDQEEIYGEHRREIAEIRETA